MRRLFVILCTNIYAFKDITMCGNSLGLAASPPTIKDTTLCPQRSTFRLFTSPPSTRAPNLTYSYTYSWYLAQSKKRGSIKRILPKEKRLTLTTFSRIRFVNSARCGYFDCGLYCCCRCSYRNRSRTTNNLLKSTPTTKSRINSMLTVICDDLRTVSHHFARSWGVVVFQNTSITLMNEWQRTGKYINNVS